MWQKILHLIEASLRSDEPVRPREACQGAVTSDRSQKPLQKRNAKYNSRNMGFFFRMDIFIMVLFFT